MKKHTSAYDKYQSELDEGEARFIGNVIVVVITVAAVVAAYFMVR
jgi:hypothetical protein